jgi:beta-N-acetylhexosaminidase
MTASSPGSGAVASAPRTSEPTRRRFLAGAAATLLTAPALLRTSPAEAAIAADVGEMLMVGFAGKSADSPPAQALAAHIARGRVGGVLFLSDNIGRSGQVAGLVSLFREAAGGRRLLIAVDQEGGRVQRLGRAEGFSFIPAALRVGEMPLDEAQALYRKVGKELAAAGFNLNLAPVADLHDPKNPIIGRSRRAYSADPGTVAAYAAACVAGLAEAGVLAAIKHFPGHGFSRGDTHLGPVDVTRTLRTAEIAPFAQLIRGGHAPIVMTAHLRHALFGGVPASLSRVAIDGILRGVLGHDGPVMTDALDMAAITREYDQRSAMLLAIGAGADLLLVANNLRGDPDLPSKLAAWVREDIIRGKLAYSRIAEAAERLRRLKRVCVAPKIASLEVAPLVPTAPAPDRG